MKKILLITALFGAVQAISAEEVSVFGAGDLTSSNAYGLTENEQVLLENRKKVNTLQREIEVQKQDIIGLRSVVEGLNSQISKLEARIADLEIKTTGRVNKQANNTANTQKKNEKLAVINNKKTTKLTNTSKKTEKVTKNKPEKIIAFDDMKKEDIFISAQELFDNKKYTEAKIRYDYLNSKDYKKAEVNFMLGEILYNQKLYSGAIEKYRNSIQIKDNAEYMPTLLYHSGLSLEKIGDTTSANKFFTVLKSQYPNSEQAKSLK
ncbi:Tol-Pal system protein YbgF [Campylobacter blaseri]|uniref:Uncharacterized protein n=1 Tax=Campylobacter blaseri TaxID=2042961 RepID=A0A2P8QZC6_9BACT|nr:tetratricopeptide repeat protein [Campylobacter blaseri]PSM51592.1 hypothetical protein CQ405_07290 [Campylobacter blaseri]PSM53385.1 hypothetical protein CRN67_07295 [Campylobacter blaseri]QKF86680.1 Tol-Pal system protein YbgF [Campylobacter blaseri]